MTQYLYASRPVFVPSPTGGVESDAIRQNLRGGQAFANVASQMPLTLSTATGTILSEIRSDEGGWSTEFWTTEPQVVVRFNGGVAVSLISDSVTALTAKSAEEKARESAANAERASGIAEQARLGVDQALASVTRFAEGQVISVEFDEDTNSWPTDWPPENYTGRVLYMKPSAGTFVAPPGLKPGDMVMRRFDPEALDPVVPVTTATPPTPIITVKSLAITPGSDNTYTATALLNANVSQTVERLTLAIRDTTAPTNDGRFDPLHLTGVGLVGGNHRFSFDGTLSPGSYVGVLAYQRTAGGPWTHVAPEITFRIGAAATVNLPPKTTSMLTYAHNTEEVAVSTLEAATSRRFNGLLVTNGQIETSAHLARPWFLRADAPYARWWTWQDRNVRNRSVVSQAPGVGLAVTNAAAVINGSQDNAILSCLSAIRTAFGDHAILRLGYKYNTLNQQPWGNGQITPADFIAVWRRWHSIARSNGFLFKFDLSNSLDGADPAPWWPGAQYVDVISTDMYFGKVQAVNPTESELLAWCRVGAPGSLDKLLARCKQFDKPYAFPEFIMPSWLKPAGTLLRGSGDHPALTHMLFDFIEQNNGTGDNVYCEYHSIWNAGNAEVGTTLEGRSNTVALPDTRQAYIQRVQRLHPA